MRTPRIHLPVPLETGARVALDSATARHLLHVLRLRPGAPLAVFNGEGGEYQGILESVAGGQAVVRLERFVAREAESPLRITLAQGISRGERMDFTLQKAVELGVARIVPLFTEYCQVRLAGERLERRHRHWQGIIAGATAQCGRTRLPVLERATSLTDWLARPGHAGDAESGLKLMLEPRARQTLAQIPRATGPVTLLIGPEGGLSAAEETAARHAGFIGLRLGPRILRTETAGMAALSALQALWGDLG